VRSQWLLGAILVFGGGVAALAQQETDEQDPRATLDELWSAIATLHLQGRLLEVKAILDRCTSLVVELDDESLIAEFFNDRGGVNLDLGAPQEAIADCERALSAYREIEDRIGQARALSVPETCPAFEPPVTRHSPWLACSSHRRTKRERRSSSGSSTRGAEASPQTSSTSTSERRPRVTSSFRPIFATTRSFTWPATDTWIGNIRSARVSSCPPA
jgi:tetratricopeptide (TPR) repeat protein